MSAPELFPKDMEIGIWRVVKHIGHGGYGEIYEVVSRDGEGPYAMKVEMRNAKKRGMSEEIRFLEKLQGSPCFPQFITSGVTPEFKYFVMELLGPSLSAVRRVLPAQRYSTFTITVIAKAMLKCLEELHRRGFVHRDVKPGNFLFRNDREQMICLIDFGLSRRFVNKATGAPLPSRGEVGFIGTCSFASLNAHDGKDLGRRDDLISWLYTIVEAVERRLPWPGSKNREQTVHMKKFISPPQLCRSLPPVFTSIMKKVMKYSFTEEPEYGVFYEMMDRVIDDLGGSAQPFDWEQLPPETFRAISDVEMPRNGVVEHETEENTIEEESIEEEESVKEEEERQEIQPQAQPEERPPEPAKEEVAKPTPQKQRKGRHGGDYEGGCKCNVC